MEPSTNNISESSVVSKINESVYQIPKPSLVSKSAKPLKIFTLFLFFLILF